MQWLLDNWIWVLLGVGMIAMHMFGHRGHGGGAGDHGSGGGCCGKCKGGKGTDSPAPTSESEAAPPAADNGENKDDR